MGTVHQITLASGLVVPVFQYNTIVNGDGFYVSHNDYDQAIYGGQTTGIVIGQMQGFYILNGDHREAYLPLISQGLAACIEYFYANIGRVNKFSDHELPDWARPIAS
jgi:hypothetical protein